MYNTYPTHHPEFTHGYCFTRKKNTVPKGILAISFCEIATDTHQSLPLLLPLNFFVEIPKFKKS